MCNLKRLALANVAFGLALVTSGCVSPTEDTATTASAQSADPGGQSEERGAREGQPGQAVEPRLPSLGREQGPEQAGQEGEQGPRGLGEQEGPMGPGGFQGPMSPAQGLMGIEQTRALVEHITDGIRARIQDSIMRSRARMLQRMEQMPGAFSPIGVGGPQGFPGGGIMQGPQGGEIPEGAEGPHVGTVQQERPSKAEQLDESSDDGKWSQHDRGDAEGEEED